eukprot:scaffold7386_cov160-Amphora_coffeaeformis.AAC.11
MERRWNLLPRLDNCAVLTKERSYYSRRLRQGLCAWRQKGRGKTLSCSTAAEQKGGGVMYRPKLDATLFS